MKKFFMLLVSFWIVALSFAAFLPSPVMAIPGDVDGSGSVNSFDVIFLLNYLFRGMEAPPNPIDADVDGSPGINMGDVLQLIGYLFTGCDLLPYTGASVRVGSEIRFSSDLISIAPGSTLDTTLINIIANGGPDLMGMVIPISFANEPNEVEVDLVSVSFDGTIIPAGWDTSYAIDNDRETLLLFPYGDNSTDPLLPEGTTGLVASLYFSEVVPGDPLAISTTEIPPSHSFTLISSYCANGTLPSERIFSPMLSLALNGDANCDGVVAAGDIVYLINYLFRNGPPPCGL